MVVKSSTFISVRMRFMMTLILLQVHTHTHTHTHIYHILWFIHQKRVLFVIIIANLIYCLFLCLLADIYDNDDCWPACLMDIIHVKVSSPEKAKRDWTPSNEWLTWFEDVSSWKTKAQSFVYCRNNLLRNIIIIKIIMI